MLDEHLGYVADSIRLERYTAAIAQTIKPGARVVDLGCGTGILGLLCLRAGAAHVVAIDSTSMIEVARQSLTRAGLAGKASFINGKAHQVEISERADVVICDQVGFFGFDYGIVNSLQDARLRFLKPDGVVLPARIELRVAAIESERCAALADGWQKTGVASEFHWLRDNAVNTKHAVDFKREELLGPPSALGEIDLRASNPEYFSWTADLHVERDGVMHGLGGWFECELAEGVWMTNSPLSDRQIRRSQVFLPLSSAIHVKAGEALKATVMTRQPDLIAWDLEVQTTGQKFSHSTWRGELLTAQDIRKRNPEHVPSPSHAGRARAIVFALCDGKRTLKQIEDTVLRDYPMLFPSAGEISRFVAQVLGQDSE